MQSVQDWEQGGGEEAERREKTSPVTFVGLEGVLELRYLCLCLQSGVCGLLSLLQSLLQKLLQLLHTMQYTKGSL